MKRVWIIQGKNQDGRLRVFVVARRDTGHPLHATSVPQLLNRKNLKSKNEVCFHELRKHAIPNFQAKLYFYSLFYLSTLNWPKSETST